MTKFKIKIRYFLAPLFVMALIAGCQKEFTKISEPDKTITISSGDTIAELITKITLKDGSFDNIVDNCSAISIKFPYSIQVNDQLVQVNTPGDIETIKLENSQNLDDIEIIFPVTVIFIDYSELAINTEDELETLQKQQNTNLEDEDNECIDFVYPINLCTYNKEFQNANCFAVNADYELYNIFSDINDLIIEPEYPLQIKTYNNDIITVNNNSELEYQINNLSGDCDENDGVDNGEPNDEVFSDTTLLTSAVWEITLFTEETDETASFASYQISFNADFTIQAATDSGTTEGTWGFNVTDGAKTLNIEFNIEETPIEWLNDEWNILLLNNDTIELQAESDSEGFTKKLNMARLN